MTITDELRRAADKLTEIPHCGYKYSDCACDYAEQLAGLLRDIVLRVEQHPDFPVSPEALDIARRINRSGSISAASVESATVRMAVSS